MSSARDHCSIGIASASLGAGSSTSHVQEARTPLVLASVENYLLRRYGGYGVLVSI